MSIVFECVLVKNRKVSAKIVDAKHLSSLDGIDSEQGEAYKRDAELWLKVCRYSTWLSLEMHICTETLGYTVIWSRVGIM